MILRVAAVMLLFTGARASAHRLDEYLQAALVSVERNKVEVELSLTPGVAVFPFVLRSFDTNSDAMISADEQRAYAARVLQDLSLNADGSPLVPTLQSVQFPAIQEMQEGRGEIEIRFSADLAGGGRDRILTFENRHQSRIAVYEVNCLLPRDPQIRIQGQKRSYTQSNYELHFEDMEAPVEPSRFFGMITPEVLFVLPFICLLLARIAIPALRGLAEASNIPNLK